MSIHTTFEYQSSLPRLPIPPISHTLSKYLESLEPISSPQELSRTRDVVKQLQSPLFHLKSVADILQDRLIDYDSTQQFSWLEKLWEDAAYLSWREPLFINSNYWITFIKDKNAYGQAEDIPSFQKLSNSVSRLQKQYLVCLNAGYSQYQVRLAAAIANKAFDYYHLVLNEQIPVQKVGQKPICMNQYKSLFGVTRLPRPECDIIYRYKGPISFFILMLKDQLFTIPLYTKKNNRILNGDLEDIISQAINQVSNISPSDLQPPIGLLTAGHRDRWSIGYSLLASHTNHISKSTLEAIQQSAFIISLEDFYSPKCAGESAWQRLVKSSSVNAHNRWFDKHINYVIDRNGNIGAVGEHSPADAVVPAIMHDYVISHVLVNPHPSKKITQDSVSQSAFRSKNPNLLPQYKDDSIPNAPIHLKFGSVDPLIHTLICETQQEVDQLERNSVSESLIINQYGSMFMKTAHVSPDSYVQLMLQLVYYKLHNEVAPTYESGSTRAFLHGRTDTIRSLTADSKNFVQTMVDPNSSDKQKYDSFVKAAQTQSKNSRLVAAGNGIDRHLLGLRFAYYKLKPLRGEPEFDQSIVDNFFNDPLMACSTNFTLSTSGLFPNETLIHTGFGVTVPKLGYGMNYTIMPNRVKFGIETKRSSKSFGDADIYKFMDGLENSFVEMKNIVLNVLKDQSVGKSKL
ncbi:Carnitine O-acetyltransferase [Smittium mucronatum]|uniref:Carnitine O-acetyltransferase n=1 Tax=Smittium mucronatum TaxID=133383 RepID=A0A1R0GN30_9FUNG|nr:Carnitine O-acetyltransferase [Smittium mucronatum]